VTDAFSVGIPLWSEAVSVPTGSGTELCFGGPGVEGGELFCYDGSTLRQVSGVWSVENLAVYDGTLYFRAYTPSTGDELYQYDGSSVTRVEDLNPGPDASKPRALTVYDGALYFKADVGNGFELWRYDGTSPTKVSDFVSSGTELARFADFEPYNGSLYMVTANDELWAYDGSSLSRAATVQSMWTTPELTVYAGSLYFVASTNTTGNFEFELTEFDGTGTSTIFNFDGNESGIPASFTVYDDGTGQKLYFTAGSSTGRELFRFDGSTASMVADLNGTESSDPEELTVYDDGSGASLYFGADDGTAGRELWRFDDSGIALVKDINSGPDGGDPSNLVTYDDGSGPKLYFEANGGPEAYGLHSYDGSSVDLQTSTNVFPTRFPDKTVYDDGSGDRLYFAATGDAAGDELYRTDGSQVTRAADINPGNRGSDPRGFTKYQGALYFRAFTPNSGSELWTDESGASLVEDINTSSSTSAALSSRPSGFTVYNNTLYFAAATGGEGIPGDGVELWRYDGSTAEQVKNLNPGSDSGIPGDGPDFTVADLGSGPSLYFVGNDGSSGRELYRYDGSSVQRLTAINQSGNSFYCCSGTPLTVYDGALYFSATDGSDGRELYRYDGTTATRVKDINPGSDGSQPRSLTVYDGTLYFSAADGNGDRELWKTDGTASGTQRVADVNASGSSRPRALSVYNDRLYFTAFTPSDGREPHGYDGSTVSSIDLNPGAGSSGGFAPAVFDDGSGPALYVSASDGKTGVELWRFDQTSAPLPVELATFEGTQTGASTVDLTWTTAAETNNAGFRVQHKAEEDDAWSTLSFVESKAGGGTTTEAHTYRFTAENLPVGTHQFRLKQKDLDGTEHVHDPVTVDLQMQEALRLGGPAPNPVRDKATVSFAVRDDAEATITLYNTLGQEVRTLYRGIPGAGEGQTVEVSTTGLSSGVYVLRLRADGRTETRRLTVVR